MKRTIVVGDVHGCLDELHDLLNVLWYTASKDRLILLGDLVDRGPNSAGVVQFAQTARAELVAGNHDDALVRYWRHEVKAASNPEYVNPMRYSKERRQILSELQTADIAYLLSAKPYIEIAPGWVAVHAGVVPGVDLERQTPTTLRHIRYIDPNTGARMSLNDDYSAPVGGVPWHEAYRGPTKVVYGHWVTNVPTTTPEWSWPTDFGCVFGGRLGAWVFEPNKQPKLVTVPARQTYAAYDMEE